MSAASLEREFFRTLNRVVEPMVRAGFGSPRIVPGGLIVLETLGRKSGRKVRTPLVATRLGGHVVVAEARADFKGHLLLWLYPSFPKGVST